MSAAALARCLCLMPLLAPQPDMGWVRGLYCTLALMPCPDLPAYGPTQWPCPTPLPASPAPCPCPSALPRAPARQPCPMPLPVSPAPCPCPSALPHADLLYQCSSSTCIVPLPAPSYLNAVSKSSISISHVHIQLTTHCAVAGRSRHCRHPFWQSVPVREAACHLLL